MNKGVQKIFSEVPRTYELVNHVLTFGLDVFWRKRLASLASRAGGTRWIDVCSGTGETAANLIKVAPRHTIIYATDFSMPMLLIAHQKPDNNRIKITISDVRYLSFSDNSFDLVTISFATRNINLNRRILCQTFKEFHRVLKPGGLFLNLETSQPQNGLMRLILHGYAKYFVKPIGSLISGSKAGYAYLANTIPRFYKPEELREILFEAGFGEVTYKKLFFGITAIHKSVK